MNEIDPRDDNPQAEAGRPEQLTARANRFVMIACLAFVASMVGMSYAAVPIYRIFSETTGYGGMPHRVAEASRTIGKRSVDVRFDANTAPGLDWDFAPVRDKVTVRLGETVEIAYRVTNRSGKAVRAQATFNVTPDAAGAYFSKVKCFCFDQSVVKAGETVELPVVFFIDPAYAKAKELRKIRTLTLSYTFFPLDEVSRGSVKEQHRKI